MHHVWHRHRSIHAALRQIDQDRSGTLSRDEIKQMLIGAASRPWQTCATRILAFPYHTPHHLLII